MRYIITAACACVLLFLGGAMAKLPAKALPLSAWIFFGVQFIGCAAAFLGLQRKPVTSGGYAIFYVASLAAMICCSAFVLGWFERLMPRPLVAIVAIGAFFISAALCAVAYYRILDIYKGQVPWQTTLILFQFAALLSFGCQAVGTWAYAQQTETDRILTLGLGAYWFAMSAWTLAYTVESVRGREQWDLWQRRAGVWPALIALVCFAWITYRFTTIQAELSRAPSQEMNETVAAEVSEAQCERSQL
jgi:hypothetical protein